MPVASLESMNILKVDQGCTTAMLVRKEMQCMHATEWIVSRTRRLGSERCVCTHRSRRAYNTCCNSSRIVSLYSQDEK
jgi:hypothetical protein